MQVMLISPTCCSQCCGSSGRTWYVMRRWWLSIHSSLGSSNPLGPACQKTTVCRQQS